MNDPQRAKLNEHRANFEQLAREKVFREEIIAPDKQMLALFDAMPNIFATLPRVLVQARPEVAEQLLELIRIAVAIFSQSNKANAGQYAQNHPQSLNEIRQAINRLYNDGREHAYFAAVLSGSLNPVSLDRLHETIQGGMSSLAEAEAAIKARAKELEDAATERAKQIEDAAHRTARNISVKAAQEQFHTAQRRSQRMALAFALIGVVMTLTLVGTAILMYQSAVAIAMQAATAPDASTNRPWAIIVSLLALKLVILSAIAYVTSMSWKMFRAYMHMSELNDHRVRVANSVDAFMAAAHTSEQEDVILIRMMESVIAFGNSGILPNDEDTIAGQKLTLDAGSLFPKSGGT